MFYLKYILKNYINCNDYRALRLSLLKIRKKIKTHKMKINLFGIIADRLKFYIRSVFLPILYVKFKKKSDYENCFLEPTFEDKELIKTREVYLRRFLKTETKGLYYKNNIIISNIKDLFIFIKYYYIGVFYSFISIFDLKRIPIYKITFFFLNLLMIKLVKPKELYMFNPHDLNNYYLLLYFSNYNDVKIFYNMGNSSLFSLKRYGYFNNSTIVLCSKLHKDEFFTYEKLGWIRRYNSEISVWGNEYIGVLETMDKKIKFDFGFFGSGEWARNKYLKRVNDIDTIQSYECKKSYHWLKVSEILNFLIEFCCKHKKTLKIFLHPHEKMILKKYSLYPPYWNKIDNKYIFASEIDEQIRSNFYEAEIGVTYFSSILFDRANYDLKTYFCYSEKLPASRFSKYISDYSNYIYTSTGELKKKLLKEL